MSKQEFLSILEAALKSGLPEIKVREHIAYYNDYISTEVNKGRAEADIIEELGDPRLLAKNILSTTRDTKSTVFEEAGETERVKQVRHSFSNKRPGWQGILTLVGVGLILLIIVALLIAIMIGIIKIFIFVVLPVAIVAGIVLFIMGLVKK